MYLFSLFSKRSGLSCACMATLLLLIISFSGLNAQESRSDSAYYAQLREYYLNLAKENPSKSKKYARLKAKVLDKLDQNGSMESFMQGMSSTCNDVCLFPDDADWMLRGPYVHEVGKVQWNGFVSRVSPDPGAINNPEPVKEAVLGTPTGGIWNFDHPLTPNKWAPATDPLQEYGLGITEIVRNPAMTVGFVCPPAAGSHQPWRRSLVVWGIGSHTSS